MNMNYFFAILIIAIWTIILIGMAWRTKTRPIVNILAGIEIMLILGIIYWVPYWLIFQGR